MRFDYTTRRTIEDGHAMAEEIGAYAYPVCPAKEEEGCLGRLGVFVRASRAALETTEKKNKCNSTVKRKTIFII